ncbi:MAG: hypothetical protein ABEJ36_04055 [Candidatus Nanosalina sp.]
MNWTSKTLMMAVLIGLTLNVAAASPADLDIFPKESSTKVNSFTSYEVTVKNTGPVDDVYELSSSNPSEITIAPQEVPQQGTLNPGESKTVQVWFNPDLDREEGTYTFTINAESQATGKSYDINGIVTVLKDHEVEVSVEGPEEVCRNEKAVYKVTITNEGTQTETFALSAEAGSFSSSRLTLEPGESSTVELTRSSNIAVTDRSFNIKAKSTSSYASDTATASFEVNACFESKTSINPDKQRQAALTEATFEVTVTNKGTRSDSFTLSSNLGELKEKELTIASGDSKSTTLSYTPQKLKDRTLTVTANGKSSSSAQATLNVFNGQNVSVKFDEKLTSVCESTMFEKNLRVKNTGAAADTYAVSTSKGNISTETVTLEPGESRRLEVDLNSSKYEVGKKHEVSATVKSKTFKEPKKTATSSFKVENCYDLKMKVVPHIASAGENRSVLYEIRLHNTGTKQNEYHVTGEGPEWISVKPEFVTVNAGETESSFIYAGIPYNQANGTIKITAVAEGEMVKKTETVKLVIGEKIKDAIRSGKGGTITGMFGQKLGEAVDAITGASNLVKLGISILVGLLVSAAILAREW